MSFMILHWAGPSFCVFFYACSLVCYDLSPVFLCLKLRLALTTPTFKLVAFILVFDIGLPSFRRTRPLFLPGDALYS